VLLGRSFVADKETHIAKMRRPKTWEGEIELALFMYVFPAVRSVTVHQRRRDATEMAIVNTHTRPDAPENGPEMKLFDSGKHHKV